MNRVVSALALAILAGVASAQPNFVTLPGQPLDISGDGNVVVGNNGGPFRYVATGPGAGYNILLAQTIGGSTFCSADGAIVAGTIPNTNSDIGTVGFAVTGLWTGSTFVEQHDVAVFPGTGSPNTLNVIRNLSRDGRFIVGFGYLSGGIGGYRGMVHDTTTNTAIRLNNVLDLVNTGTRVLCISDDGLVCAGDDGTTGSAQRPCIWRRASLSDPFVGQVVEPGTGGIGGATVNCISADGSTASGWSYLDGNKLVRWVYNVGTSSYDKVILATTLANSATALTRVESFAMTPDGSMIFGRYNNSRAFIWTAASGEMRDLTTDLVAEGMVGAPAGYVVGSVVSCSNDGRELAVLGSGFGNPSGVIYRDGGTCAPVASVPTSSTTQFSMCTTTIIQNAGAAGSGPFTYQHRKNGVPIVDGLTGNVNANGIASTYAGATTSQMRVNNAGPLDAGQYDCIITNACGSVTTPVRDVTALAADPYDTCATALDASGTGTFSFNMCGLYVHDGAASCTTNNRADLWIRYTALAAGNYRITNCGQSFDTILSAFDSCGGPEIAGSCSNDFCGSAASIEFLPLAENQTVYIRLAAGAAVPGAPVNILVEIPPPPPANDLCANATVITDPGAYPWDNTYAFTDGTSSCRTQAGKDVWFKYVAPGRGAVSFTTCGSALNTVLSTFDTCGGTQLACNDNANVTGCTFQSAINNVNVFTGTEMLVRVAANTINGTGTGNLNVTFVPSTCIQDFNGDGTVDPDDLGDYINCYFSIPPCPRVDINNDGNTDPDDLGDFINAYFGPGC